MNRNRLKKPCLGAILIDDQEIPVEFDYLDIFTHQDGNLKVTLNINCFDDVHKWQFILNAFRNAIEPNKPKNTKPEFKDRSEITSRDRESIYEYAMKRSAEIKNEIKKGID